MVWNRHSTGWFAGFFSNLARPSRCFYGELAPCKGVQRSILETAWYPLVPRPHASADILLR